MLVTRSHDDRIAQVQTGQVDLRLSDADSGRVLVQTLCLLAMYQGRALTTGGGLLITGTGCLIAGTGIVILLTRHGVFLQQGFKALVVGTGIFHVHTSLLYACTGSTHMARRGLHTCHDN